MAERRQRRDEREDVDCIAGVPVRGGQKAVAQGEEMNAVGGGMTSQPSELSKITQISVWIITEPTSLLRSVEFG